MVGQIESGQMIYRFEDFELNTSRQELLLAGVAQSLQPQVYGLLELLVANHDRIVTKDEINEKIWGGRIISESVVNSRIRSVRLAVNDNGKSQRLIKTIHSRGFGFAVVPEIVDRPDAAQGQALREIADEDRRVQTKAENLENLSLPPSNIAIAVLPFQNMSQDSGQGHFSDGISEDITTALTNVMELSVFTHVVGPDHDRKSINIKDIGQRYNVEYVLDGSVRRVGDQFRVSAQLIDVARESHVWAQRYDRKMQNVFALQDEMTREIISALQVELTDGEIAKIWASGTSSFAAWEAMLKARKHCMKHTKADVLAGRKFAEQAIEIDSAFSSAWRWFSFSFWAEALGGWSENPVEALFSAKKAAERSASLDDDNAGTLGLLSLINVALRQHDIANQTADRIVEMGSTNDYAIGAAAMAKLFCGEVDTAAVLIDHAIKLAPASKAEHYAVRGMVQLFLKRYEEAIESIEKCLLGSPDFLFAHSTLAIIYSEMDRLDEARKVAQKVLDINPDFVVQTYSLYQPYRDEGMITRCLDGLRKAGIPNV